MRGPRKHVESLGLQAQAQRDMGVATSTENAVYEELKKGTVRPCYLLLGSDRRAKERLFAAIRDAAVAAEDQDLAVAVFDGEGASASEIVEAAATVPFLGARRVVRVRRFEALAAEEQAVVAEWIARAHSSAVVVLDADAVDKRRKAIELLQTHVAEVALDEPAGDRLIHWLRQEASRLGLRLDPQAARSLIARAGQDMGTLVLELEKLQAFLGSGDVDTELIEEVVATGVQEAEQFAIFRLCDAVSEGKPGAALDLLDQLLAAGQSPIYINVMLARQFRLLLAFRRMAGESPIEIARRLNLRGARFGHEKLARQAAKFSSPDLEAAIGLLLETDLKLKRSALMRPTLETLVVRLATRRFGALPTGNEKTG